MPAYHPAFLCGEKVRLRPPDDLQKYVKGVWEWHHPIPSDALNSAESERKIVAVHFYHMGDVLYELDEPPGLLWHEGCIQDYMNFMPEWQGYPLAKDYYKIEPDMIDGQPVVTVCDIRNVECLRVRRELNTDWARAMREVATVRHLAGFEQRYGIEGTYDKRSETGFIRYWPDTPSWFLNAVVISISEGDNEITVKLRRTDNRESLLQFAGVKNVKAIQAIGLVAYDIAEYECDDSCRWYEFVNADTYSDAELRIAAESLTLVADVGNP